MANTAVGTLPLKGEGFPPSTRLTRAFALVVRFLRCRPRRVDVEIELWRNRGRRPRRWPRGSAPGHLFRTACVPFTGRRSGVSSRALRRR